MSLDLTKLLASGCLAITAGAIAHSSHQPIPNVINNAGDVEISYEQPYAGIGKLSSLACVVGSGYFLSAALRSQKLNSDGVGEASGREVLVSPRASLVVESDESIRASKDQPEVVDRRSSEFAAIKTPLLAHQKTGFQESAQPKQVIEQTAKLPNIFDRVFNFRNRMLLIPAATGAGKTTLLLLLIKFFHQKTDGNVEFYGSSSKLSPWMGLEDETAEDGYDRILYVNPAKPETILHLVTRFKWLRDILIARQGQRKQLEAANKPYQPQRVIIVCEEWNSTLAVAEDYDRICKNEGLKSDVFGELTGLFNYFLNSGREDEFALWVFAQDHQVQNIHVNTGFRKNLGNLVPFTLGSMETLEDALLGRSPLIVASKAKQLMELCEGIAKKNPNTFYVYSNLFGHEILLVPFDDQIKRHRMFGKNNVVEMKTKRDMDDLEKDLWEA
jgi:energy-coupling factor transporter ATP-binding protein EcfA2